jgi:hypothetical protein
MTTLGNFGNDFSPYLDGEKKLAGRAQVNQ